MNNSGIYLITNTITGRVYVGSAKNIAMRWKAHRFALKNKTHHSIKLQRSWDKHGESQFIFSISEIVDDVEMIVKIEQEWIEKMNSFVNGYNSNPVAGSSLGRKLSEETRKKISIGNKGKVRTLSDKMKQSASIKGIPLSKEHREKIGASQKGKVISKESRLKMSIAQKKRAERESVKRSKYGRFIKQQVDHSGMDCVYQKNEDHPRVKYSDKTVEAIRKSGLGPKKAAQVFGLSVSQAGKIINMVSRV